MLANGKEIRLKREEAGLTQAQLASELGVTETTIGNWESGRVNAPPRRMSKIFEVLQKFLGNSGRRVGNATLEEPEPTMLGQLSKITDALIAQQEDTRSLIKLLGDNQKSLERQQDLFSRALDQKDFEHRRMEKRIAELETKLNNVEKERGGGRAATI